MRPESPETIIPPGLTTVVLRGIFITPLLSVSPPIPPFIPRPCPSTKGDTWLHSAFPHEILPNCRGFAPLLELDNILSTFNKLLLIAGVDIAAISTTGAVDRPDGADMVIVGAAIFALFKFILGAVTVIGVALYILSQLTVGVVTLPVAVIMPLAAISREFILSQLRVDTAGGLVLAIVTVSAAILIVLALAGVILNFIGPESTSNLPLRGLTIVILLSLFMLKLPLLVVLMAI